MCFPLIDERLFLSDSVVLGVMYKDLHELFMTNRTNKSKTTKKNRFVVFLPQMHTKLQQNGEQQQNLRRISLLRIIKAESWNLP